MAIIVKSIIQKKKVTRTFVSIYQSSFFMLVAKEMNNDERFCEEIGAVYVKLPLVDAFFQSVAFR
jgi:hypothetical protein